MRVAPIQHLSRGRPLGVVPVGRHGERAVVQGGPAEAPGVLEVPRVGPVTGLIPLRPAPRTRVARRDDGPPVATVPGEGLVEEHVHVGDDHVEVAHVQQRGPLFPQLCGGVFEVVVAVHILHEELRPLCDPRLRVLGAEGVVHLPLHRGAQLAHERLVEGLEEAVPVQEEPQGPPGHVAEALSCHVGHLAGPVADHVWQPLAVVHEGGAAVPALLLEACAARAVVGREGREGRGPKVGARLVLRHPGALRVGGERLPRAEARGGVGFRGPGEGCGHVGLCVHAGARALPVRGARVGPQRRAARVELPL
mmetsp:Transcript_19586/g.65803  ORF Transcript_19586/g.65803 Transcript_19586/m.65803 type:complete len:308 (+) Transcript_19586:2843-3766(+)